jgi:hypothetical protein
MEKTEIKEMLKRKHEDIIKNNEKIRYSEGNFCVYCISSNYYYPEKYPYKEYICYNCYLQQQKNLFFL